MFCTIMIKLCLTVLVPVITLLSFYPTQPPISKIEEFPMSSSGVLQFFHIIPLMQQSYNYAGHKFVFRVNATVDTITI